MCSRTGAPIDVKRTLLSWSSGKDSAWSFHILRQQNEYEIVGLLTTFNRAANRVAMHGVRRSLVEAQAKAAGVPLWDIVNLSHDPLGQLTHSSNIDSVLGLARLSKR
jgi:diphthamide synthase (EF-2-diphthine--ammonia ligase)